MMKSVKFRTYTLEDIIKQINQNKYDTFTPFIQLATHFKNYKEFNKVRQMAQTRIESFRKRTLTSQQNIQPSRLGFF